MDINGLKNWKPSTSKGCGNCWTSPWEGSEERFCKQYHWKYYGDGINCYGIGRYGIGGRMPNCWDCFQTKVDYELDMLRIYLNQIKHSFHSISLLDDK